MMETEAQSPSVEHEQGAPISAMSEPGIPVISESSEALEADTPRVFLVVVDDSEEMNVALRFACLRARNTGGRVALLYVQEPAEFHHWLGIGQIIHSERREEAEARLSELSAKAQEISGSMPMVIVREGKRGEAVMSLLEEDPTISIIVLAASASTDGPGPIISYLMKNAGQRLTVPLTIVPGNLSDDDVDNLT